MVVVLPAPIGPQETEYGAGRNLEREIVKGSNRREIPRQSLRANCRFRHVDLSGYLAQCGIEK